MPLSPRISVPIACAALLALTLGGVLFWQLERTRASLGSPVAPEEMAQASARPMTAIGAGNDALGLLRKGDIMALRGDWKDAQDAYQASVDAGGGMTALRKLAQAQLNRRDLHGVQETIDRLRREGARNEDILLLESIVNLRTGELEKARSVLTAAEESPQKHYGLALLSIVTGDNETAKRELDLVEQGWEPVLRSYAKVLKTAYNDYALFPKSPEIHLMTLIARALAQVQECELSLPLLSQVTSIQDDYRDAWIVQGFCELSTERFPEALASLERAYQLDPEKPETQYFLARTYRAQGDHANAITFLQYSLENGFQPASEAKLMLAKEAVLANNFPLALDQYNDLTTATDSSLETFSDYVTLAIQADRKQEAVVKAEEATTRFAEQPEAWVLLGKSKAAIGDKDAARTAFNRALEIDPQYQSARQALDNL